MLGQQGYFFPSVFSSRGGWFSGFPVVQTMKPRTTKAGWLAQGHAAGERRRRIGDPGPRALITCLLLSEPLPFARKPWPHGAHQPLGYSAQTPAHLPKPEGLSKKGLVLKRAPFSLIVPTVSMSSYDTGKGRGDPRPGFWSKNSPWKLSSLSLLTYRWGSERAKQLWG